MKSLVNFSKILAKLVEFALKNLQTFPHLFLLTFLFFQEYIIGMEQWFFLKEGGGGILVTWRIWFSSFEKNKMVIEVFYRQILDKKFQKNCQIYITF
jgi:hypothetical protein